MSNAETQWYIKWADTVNLWLAAISRIAEIQKPIVKEIGVTCPKCKEGNIIERKSKKKQNFLWLRSISGM